MATTSAKRSDAKYDIRTMTQDELAFIVELATGEGWNPGIYDTDCYYGQDPNGFRIGLLDGEPVSCISVVRYGDTYGHLGFYIVKEGFRGRGLGIQIWTEGMKYLEGRDVGLDGMVAEVPRYEKSGFKFAHLSARYRGEALGGGRGSDDNRIVELQDIPHEELKAYDDDLFPASRPEFLKRWVSRPQACALGIKVDDQLAGYAVLGICQEGYKIGPLFADDETLAEALFMALSRHVPRETPIFLDVPGEAQNPAATALARRHGMEEIFQTARMYRMAQPSSTMALPLDRWFGVTTFELG